MRRFQPSAVRILWLEGCFEGARELAAFDLGAGAFLAGFVRLTGAFAAGFFFLNNLDNIKPRKLNLH